MKKVRLFESFIGEASRGEMHKAAKKGSYPVTIVITNKGGSSDGEVAHQETVDTPAAVPAAMKVLYKKYATWAHTFAIEDATGKILFQEGLELDEDVNEWYSLQHGGGEFKQMDRRVNDADKIGVGKALAKIWNSLGIADGDFDHEQAWAYVVSFMDGSPKFRRLLESFNSTDDSEVNESLQYGSYYFPKGNVDPVMQPAKGETKYVVICHNTVEMGNNIMYLKDASSNTGQNFDGHVLSAFNTEEEAVKAYNVALKAGKGMTPSCVSFAYGTLTVKGINLPFEEIDGKRKIIK